MLYSLLFYKILGLIDAKLIVLMQSLSERLKYFSWNKPLIYLISKMLNSADKVLTLSTCAHPPLQKTFKVPANKLSTFYFGVDVDYWNVNPISKRKDTGKIHCNEN